MKLSGRGAMRSRAESKRLESFGKMWKPGDTAIVYFPIFQNEEDGKMDTLVYYAWGHAIDPKTVKLKRVFIPTNSELGDNHKPKIGDTLYQFSKISRLFLTGQKEKEIAKIENSSMARSEKTTAITEIEEKFKNANPPVGKLACKVVTECVYVPMIVDGSNEKPDTEKVRLVSKDMSDGLLGDLFNIANDLQFGVTPDAKYVEVKFAFGTDSDKKIAGKVTPTGVTKDFSLENRFPEEFKKIKSTLDQLPESADLIKTRNSNFVPVSEAAIIAKLQSYAALNGELLDEIKDPQQIDQLKAAAGIIADLSIDIKNEEVLQAIEERKAKLEEEAASLEANSEAPKMEALISNEDIEEAEKAHAEETIDDLVGQYNNMLDSGLDD